MTRSAVVVLAMALFLPALCAAEEVADKDGYAHPGLYVGVGGVYVFEDFAKDLEDVGVRRDNGGGVDVRAGYRFHPAVAAELAFNWLTPDVDAESIWTVTANGKLYSTALTGRIQPYGILGVGVITSGRTNVIGRFGLGLETYITRHFLLSFEAAFMKPGGSFDNDFDYIPLTLAGQYRF